MEKKLFINRLFSIRRERLIDKCLELQRQGKRFLYIMPSSAAIFQARGRFMRENRGLLGSRVIVFDDLEMDIVKGHIPLDRIIYSPMDRMIIAETCKNLKDSLGYYRGIYDKRGFHQEVSAFIRSLKRNCLGEDDLAAAANTALDEVFRDKLMDIQLIVHGYNSMLKDNGIYDRNDISIKALEFVKVYKELDRLDSIIIDGFTDIEAVSMELIRKIMELDKVNIYISCPYDNTLADGFIKREIEKPFGQMGFEILREDIGQYEASSWVKELCTGFYSGQGKKGIKGDMRLIKYSCIEAEVRETARSIKKRLVDGEGPHEIAVYINNREEYSNPVLSVFMEFGIPVSMSREIPLQELEIVRKIIRGLDYKSGISHTLEEWIGNLGFQLESRNEYIMKLIKKTLDGDVDYTDRLEMKGLDAMRNLVEATREGFIKASMEKELMTGDEFFKYIHEAIASVSITMEQGNNSGVRIMDTALAKGTYYNHIYILGINEGDIPKTPVMNGLFDSHELRWLADFGIRFRDYFWELEREKIRFNLSLASARRSIALSFRTSDEDGRYKIASPFIDEIRRIMDIGNIEEWNMRKRFELPFESAMSSQELKSGYIKRFFERKYKDMDTGKLKGEGDIAEDWSSDLERIIAGGCVEHHRETSGEFSEYEGILSTDFSSISDALCSFSPTALNTYLKCPFKYLASQLYQPGREDEAEEEFSDLEVGDFYHRVLNKYYRNGSSLSSFDEKHFKKCFDEVIADIRILDVGDGEIQGIRSEWWNTLSNFIALDIERLNEYEAVTGNILRPGFLEHTIEDSTTFGVCIKCTIDRIDLEYASTGEELVPTGRYVIYDYKKKSIKGINDILQNQDYQLAIYHILMEDRLKSMLGTKSIECMALLYLSIEKTDVKLELDGLYKSEYKKALGITKKGDIRSDNFMELIEYLKSLMLETIALIKSGKFNYKPMCGSLEGYAAYPCEYEGLCRYSRNKVRVLGGEWHEK